MASKWQCCPLKNDFFGTLINHNFIDDGSGDEREYVLIATNANDDLQSLAEAQALPDWNERPEWIL